MIRIGIDVGGTFTDLVAMDDDGGRWTVLKLPSTPHDPSIAVLAGLQELWERENRPHVSFLGHGTTAGTNAFLTRKGARTALLATDGFEDVLEFRRMDRSGTLDPYDLQIDFPKPLVPGRHRLGVRERIGAGGVVVEPMTDAEVARTIMRLEELQPEAVAIALLWSFQNPSHECRLADAVRAALPDAYVSVSHEIDPDLMEYERTSTTVLNAYLGPLIHRYMTAILAEVTARGLPAPNIMQSNGGMTSIGGAIAKPVALLESGPAGGIAACTFIARELGIEDLLAVDMGGTSFDTALILGGEPQQVLETNIDGHAVRVPMLDIRSIGAGGGSLAWVDRGGSLRVGPDSAGADPGPASYGRGGAEPTVTDASVVLGYLQDLAGGRMRVDRGAAEAALLAGLCSPLGIDLVAAASGVHRIVTAHMADAMRVIASERGINPSELALIAFGGAGPIHASTLARELDIALTIIPPHPGALSALGVATSDIIHDHTAAVNRPIPALDVEVLDAIYAELEGTAKRRLVDEGCDPGQIELERYVVARYVGQLHHLEVPVVSGILTPASIEKTTEAFHDRHRRLFGFAVEGEPVYVISARLRGRARVPKPRFVHRERTATPLPTSTRQAWFPVVGFVDCPVYARPELPTERPVEGPAVINEYDSTTIVLPGQTWAVDEIGAIRIEEHR